MQHTYAIYLRARAPGLSAQTIISIYAIFMCGECNVPRAHLKNWARFVAQCQRLTSGALCHKTWAALPLPALPFGKQHSRAKFYLWIFIYMMRKVTAVPMCVLCIAFLVCALCLSSFSPKLCVAMVSRCTAADDSSSSMSGNALNSLFRVPSTSFPPSPAINHD